jgi:D-alanyl-lipoteichoic acid acyltransferase DltB (MBOAT superfamily)
MTFIELDYLLVFLPLVVISYYLLRGTIWVNVLILVASYYFYGASTPWYLIPLVVTSLIDFLVGIRLSKADRQGTRRAWLILSLTANLGLLGFFKYTPWLIGEINGVMAWAGVHYALPALAVVLPPGISFYTFQTMSYTIEIYRREMAAARNLVDYMAFVTFWPHLVAGPIMRARNLLRQLETLRPVIEPDEFRYALSLIAWGIFKKLALADNFGNIVDAADGVVQAHVLAPGLGLLFAYAFAGQIYCDFSAYTDIARGSAKLIGVELVRNFQTPYFSASPGEFWRRWHISLSTWLRDYLYIPLGGNRHGRWTEYRNLMITMTLGGLWHGAGILFVLWGIYHGAMLVLYRLVPIDRYLIGWLGKIGKGLSIFINFHIVCFGWILFRAHTDTILPLLQSMEFWHFQGSFGISYYYTCGIAILGAFVMITDYLGYRRDVEFPELFRRWNPYVVAGMATACYFGITIFARREAAQFIYFQF